MPQMVNFEHRSLDLKLYLVWCVLLLCLQCEAISDLTDTVYMKLLNYQLHKARYQ